MAQDADSQPHICITCISSHKLDVVHEFVYLGFTISDSLSLDTGRSSTSGSALRHYHGQANNQRMWSTAVALCMSTLLQGSESWATRARQELLATHHGSEMTGKSYQHHYG
mgnify:CR=1 FL=1